MKSKFEELMEQAHELRKHLCTEWADEHEKEYDDFADAIFEAYATDEITAKEHDDLALEAFYDFFDFQYYD